MVTAKRTIYKKNMKWLVNVWKRRKNEREKMKTKERWFEN